jgi:hypothetical protein
MVPWRHGRPIGIADLPAQRGGQEILRHMLFIAESSSDQGPKKGCQISKEWAS